MRGIAAVGVMFLGLILGGCIHVKGVVIEEPSGKPLTTAKFTVGRPDGIAIFEIRRTDDMGRFDFFIGPTDDNALYVYDSAGPMQSTMRRIDRQEISQNMRLHIRRAPPDMTPGFGVVP